jgi:hypothetical protein
LINSQSASMRRLVGKNVAPRFMHSRTVSFSLTMCDAICPITTRFASTPSASKTSSCAKWAPGLVQCVVMNKPVSLCSLRSAVYFVNHRHCDSTERLQLRWRYLLRTRA